MTNQKDEIPAFFIERACEVLNDGREFFLAGKDYKHPYVRTVARYIMQHEEAPVDPLLIEARELACKFAPDWWSREEIMAGCTDEHAAIQHLYTALRRGIEIERERSA